MAHLRKRHLEEGLSKTLAFSPIVGVLGHRQVGKTTLVEQFADQYVSLDSKVDREQAEQNPRQFLTDHKAHPLVIDECQKSPQIFDEMKEWVRTHKKPGQLLLTGSVRFTSKKTIRESLTGRILYHELLPLTVSEIERRPLSGIVRSLIKARDLQSWANTHSRNHSAQTSLTKSIQDYQVLGGLPGIFAIRSEKLRVQKIQDQLQTILDRDLREIFSTRLSTIQIFDFVESLAQQEGIPFSYTQIQKESGVSQLNAKKLLSALESVFLIRLLKVEGGRKGWIYYFEDQAESLRLSSGKLDPMIYYSGFLYRNIRAEFFYGVENDFRFFHYLTRHQTSLPFAVEWESKNLGFLPLQNSKPSHSEIMAAHSFLKSLGDSKVIMIHPKTSIEILSERVVIVPDHLLF